MVERERHEPADPRLPIDRVLPALQRGHVERAADRARRSVAACEDAGAVMQPPVLRARALLALLPPVLLVPPAQVPVLVGELLPALLDELEVPLSLLVVAV